jgi:hypothetical protein
MLSFSHTEFERAYAGGAELSAAIGIDGQALGPAPQVLDLVGLDLRERADAAQRAVCRR